MDILSLVTIRFLPDRRHIDVAWMLPSETISWSVFQESVYCMCVCVCVNESEHASARMQKLHRIFRCYLNCMALRDPSVDRIVGLLRIGRYRLLNVCFK